MCAYYAETLLTINYIHQGKIEAFPEGCNSQGFGFPESERVGIPQGEKSSFFFPQEFVILLTPNSAESQKFRGV